MPYRKVNIWSLFIFNSYLYTLFIYSIMQTDAAVSVPTITACCDTVSNVDCSVTTNPRYCFATNLGRNQCPSRCFVPANLCASFESFHSVFSTLPNPNLAHIGAYMNTWYSISKSHLNPKNGLAKRWRSTEKGAAGNAKHKSIWAAEEINAFPTQALKHTHTHLNLQLKNARPYFFFLPSNFLLIFFFRPTHPAFFLFIPLHSLFFLFHMAAEWIVEIPLT